MAVPVTNSSNSLSDRNQPSSCNDPSYNFVVGNFFVLEGSPGGGSTTVVNGVVNSLCCVGTLQLDVSYNNPNPPHEVTDPGIFGLFKVYVNLSNIGSFDLLSMLLNNKPSIDNNNLSEWPLPNINNWKVGFSRPDTVFGNINYYINFAFIRNVDIMQGTIPPSHNQTKYNATKQNYLSCLENGTRKINFTKNTVKQNNVIRAYCTTCAATISYSITTSGSVSSANINGYTIYTFDTSGNAASLTVDISNVSCGGRVTMDYLVVGGGGGGGANIDPHGRSAAGGGGSGDVGLGSIYIYQTQIFNILAGNGGNGGVWVSSGTGEGQDGSDSTLSTVYDASGGKGAPPYSHGGAPSLQGASNGGASGSGHLGGNLAISTSPGPSNPRIWPVAGGGGGGAIGAGGNGSVNILDASSGDASGGIGGIGLAFDVSGWALSGSTYYGVGGGGGAMPYKTDAVGSLVDASGIGGIGCGNILDPSGGHGGPSSIMFTTSPQPFDGRDASCWGSGGGGAAAVNINQGDGGNGKRGIVVIRIKNPT